MKRIGKLYEEKILSLPKKDLTRRELPPAYENIKIENALFGWRLYSGKDYIECRSKEEARYLKIFLELSLSEVYIPKDDDYLRLVLEEMERVKAKTDEIIDSYLNTIFDPKVKKKVRQEVYRELIGTSS